MNEIEKLQIIPSKSGDNTLLINDKFVHSKYNPSIEGNSDFFESHSIVFIFGIGLGYHLINLAKNNADCSFVVYDFHKKLIDNFVSTKQDFLNQYPNILFLNNFSYISLENFFDTYSNNGTARICFFKNSYLNLYPDVFSQFQNFVKQSYEIFIQNILTKSNFTHLWTKNFIYNISNMTDKHLISFNNNQIIDKENFAVIVCAGPTAKDEFYNIVKYRDKITLFAVDAVLKPLLSNKIIPDFIFTVDGQIFSYDDFPQEIPEQCTLFCDIVSYPQIGRQFRNVFYTINDAFYKKNISELFFEKLNKNISSCFINISGTVANYALNLAIKLGFSKIIFVGLDLSYPNFTTHLTGTPVYDRLLSLNKYFSTLDTKFCSIISKRKIVDTQNKIGNKVISDFVLQNYATGFENIDLKENNISVFNIKNNGTMINNFVNTNFYDCLEHSNSVNIRETILQSKIFKIKLEKKEIANNLKNLCDKIFSISNQIKSLYEQTNWNETKNVEKWENLLSKCYKELPFLRQFMIMQDIIYYKTQKQNLTLLFYKNYGFILLQSCYFLIRTLQKGINLLN